MLRSILFPLLLWLSLGAAAQLPYPRLTIEADRNLAVEITLYRLQLHRLPILENRFYATDTTRSYRLRYIQSERIVTWGIKKGEHQVYNGRGDSTKIYTASMLMKQWSNRSDTEYLFVSLRRGHLEIRQIYHYIGNAIYFDQFTSWYFEEISNSK